MTKVRITYTFNVTVLKFLCHVGYVLFCSMSVSLCQYITFTRNG